MRIKKESLLYSDNSNYDYIDSYKYIITDLKNKIGLSEITKAFVKPGPKWFERLFTLRNKIAAIFNLKTPTTIITKAANEWETGTQIGIFKVFGKTTTEIVLGEDDKHLDVRISLFLKQNRRNKNEKRITVTTAVKLHNQLGRIYFFFIKPVHKMIVPFILKQKFKQLESEINK